MYRLTAQILGIIVGLLGLVGLFIEGEHFLGFMNVDLTLDIARLVIAAALLYVGFGPASTGATRSVIGVVGGLYVVMGLLAFADTTMFGLLPTGFTGFDIGFHLVVGAAALVIAFLPPRIANQAGPSSHTGQPGTVGEGQGRPDVGENQRRL